MEPLPLAQLTLAQNAGDQETDRSRNRPRLELVLDAQVADVTVGGVGALVIVVGGERQLLVRQEGQAETDVVDVLAWGGSTDRRCQLGKVDHAEGRGRSVVVEFTRVADTQLGDETPTLDRHRIS